MKKNIEVHYRDVDNEEHHLTMFRPKPSNKFIPEWFKVLRSSPEKATVKVCNGVYDVMSLGYTISWTKDVTITKTPEGRMTISLTREPGNRSSFSSHPHFQMGQFPLALLSFQEHGVDKFLTTYRIKTDPGTSILVMQPAYHPDLKTEIMPGIIDTDTFYGEINILFILKSMNTDKEVRIKAGTPLAQVFPFIRSDWEMSYKGVDEKKARTHDENLNSIHSFYKKFLWTRKSFTEKGKK